ncbi:hypothetical protein BGW38_004593 [Lunasporangiospora selenospora]|uniref:F-box domain-containing protein n=1 Tax=Lunasporangiospora selenospora TaxID=979761 RepID=A0A9P6FR25_9FUNG|nr:hypothetical protein BGW38_004593 [Lunasporangiospora selenospora]
MEKALSIPEIRMHIGRFLSTRDLKSCAVLSRAWAESLTPWLWWSVTVRSKDNPGFIETVSKHAGHVRSLCLGGHNLSKKQYVQFQALKFIKFTNDPTNPSFEDNIIALIKRNRPTLGYLRAGNCRGMKTETLRAILDSPSLKSLSLVNLALREKELAEELLQTFTRMTRLDIVKLNPSGWSMLCTPTQVFCHLTSLRITVLEHPDHLGFLKACPNLRRLITNLKNTITRNEFTRALLASCPKLHALYYCHDLDSTIGDMNRLIQGLPPMKYLQVKNLKSSYYVTTPNMFSRHFATLQVVRFDFLYICSGQKLLTILTSCPNLRYISGGSLRSQDIDPLTPWVCLGLEYFDSRILWHPEEQAMLPTLWMQLSRLTRLCYLTIGSMAQSSPTSNITSFGLDEGLKLLEPLKQLAHFETLGPSLEWHEKEVEWVIQSWPCLCSIHGEIQQDEEERKDLWKRLNYAGIYLRNHPDDISDYINSL